WLRVTTGEAAQIAAEAEQFREYLCSSAFGSMNESTFSRWAGYALALDVEDQWLAALDRDVDESLSSRPGWYQGDNFDEFYIRSSAFNRGLVRAAGIPYAHGSGGSGGGYGG